MIGTSIRFKIRHEFLICLMLVITTYFVYRQVISHSFVIYDDGLYITENLRVQAGQHQCCGIGHHRVFERVG